MSSAAEKQFAAAREFCTVIVDKLTNDQGVHANTAIASAARMAGTFLLRSFNLPLNKLEPGAPVLSDAANEKGPFLVDLMSGVLQQMNVAIDPGRVAAAQGQGDAPQLSLIDTQALLETDLTRIKENYQLNYEQAGHAGAIATALLIRKCAEVLDPHIAFSLAAYSFVEGTKTVPQRIELDASGTDEKRWYKFWQ
jgi:hypothetical protein